MTLDGPLLVVHGHRDGNAVGGRDAISAECVARLERALRYARKHRVGAVLLCGAGNMDGVSEARQMAARWPTGGPPVHLDERSGDSAENAWEASRWARKLGAKELVVVSSWWHVRLRVFYRHPCFIGLAVRHVNTRRMRRLCRHFLHELRYLPRALRLTPQ